MTSCCAGGLSRETARQRLDDSKLFAFTEGDERDFRFPEVPYYHAMILLYGRTNPLWQRNPEVWPPPEGYRDGA